MTISKKIVTEIFSIVFAFFFSVAVQGQALPGPDPLQMENAPDLGYQPVPHGLKIPQDIELGAASSVVWTKENHLIHLCGSGESNVARMLKFKRENE